MYAGAALLALAGLRVGFALLSENCSMKAEGKPSVVTEVGMFSLDEENIQERAPGGAPSFTDVS
jgi:hypothetical protein